MDEFTCEYEFEQLTLKEFGEGMLLYGTAELASDQEPGEFYVKNIKLGDTWLDRCDGSFEGRLFKRISIALYADDDVGTFYTEQYEEGNKPDLSHVYKATREAVAMGEGA